MSLVDYTNPNSPLELQSGFTNYGNFVDYVLDSDIEFNISRKTNGDYEISWSYKSGDHTGRSLCLTDNLVTSHISYRNTTTRVRIEIRDVRSTLGEWANSGTSLPADLGRIDGVKAVDAMLNNVQGNLNSSGWNLILVLK